MIVFNRKNKGDYTCFNNMTSTFIDYNNEPYRCAESAWQAQKCADPDERKCFFLLPGPAARRLGAVINKRPDWDEIQYEILVKVLTAKFEQNIPFRKVLLSTGDEPIVYDTTGLHDNLLGRCNCNKCLMLPSQNLLGKALEEVRSKLREES